MLLYCFLGDCRWKKRDWARSVGETFADLPTKVLPSGFRVGGVHFVSNHKTKLFNGAPLGCRWVGERVCIGNRIKSYVCKTTFIIIIVGHVFVKFKLSSGPPPTASVGHPRNDMS